MFCESLETRRFLTVTLQPGTPPQFVAVTQDGNGTVHVTSTGGGSKAVMNVAVSEDKGTVDVTEITTGATWIVTNAFKQVQIQGGQAGLIASSTPAKATLGSNINGGQRQRLHHRRRRWSPRPTGSGVALSTT